MRERIRTSATKAPSSGERTSHRAWITIVVTGLVIGTAFIAVYVGLQRDPMPAHLPIAAAGARLSAAAEGEFGDSVDVTRVQDAGEGARLVRRGDAVASIALTSPGTIRLDLAGARGVSESSAARALVTGLAAGARLGVREHDLVPLVRYDSRGLVGFYVVFGVTLSSFVLAQGLSGLVSQVQFRHRVYAIVGFAVLIGLIAATVAGPVFGALTAPFPILTVTLVLLSAASAMTTKALATWLGPAGNAVAILALTTVGNAVSGATIGYDLLPAWARALSPILPPGAAFRAVNEYGYFHGDHAWTSLLVLALWATAGMLVLLVRQIVPSRRGMRSAEAPARG